LMDTKPVPGKVVAQNNEEGFGATTYTLSNGIKVTIKPTDFKSDEILIKGIKKGGENSYGVADRFNAHFAVDVIESMGFGQFNPTDLGKVLAGKTVQLNEKILDVDAELNGGSTVKDFETLMQLTYLTIMQPRKDVGLFNAFKDKQKTMLAFISSNPQA